MSPHQTRDKLIASIIPQKRGRKQEKCRTKFDKLNCKLFSKVNMKNNGYRERFIFGFTCLNVFANLNLIFVEKHPIFSLKSFHPQPFLPPFKSDHLIFQILTQFIHVTFQFFYMWLNVICNMRMETRDKLSLKTPFSPQIYEKVNRKNCCSRRERVGKLREWLKMSATQPYMQRLKDIFHKTWGNTIMYFSVESRQKSQISQTEIQTV